MRKKFNNINIFESATENVCTVQNISEERWETAEHIQVKPIYTAEDLKAMEHLDYAAGIPPFLRDRKSVV